jgi:hypothetical protein
MEQNFGDKFSVFYFANTQIPRVLDGIQSAKYLRKNAKKLLTRNDMSLVRFKTSDRYSVDGLSKGSLALLSAVAHVINKNPKSSDFLYSARVRKETNISRALSAVEMLGQKYALSPNALAFTRPDVLFEIIQSISGFTGSDAWTASNLIKKEVSANVYDVPNQLKHAHNMAVALFSYCMATCAPRASIYSTNFIDDNELSFLPGTRALPNSAAAIVDSMNKSIKWLSENKYAPLPVIPGWPASASTEFADKIRGIAMAQMGWTLAVDAFVSGAVGTSNPEYRLKYAWGLDHYLRSPMEQKPVLIVGNDIYVNKPICDLAFDELLKLLANSDYYILYDTAPGARAIKSLCALSRDKSNYLEIPLILLEWGTRILQDANMVTPVEVRASDIMAYPYMMAMTGAQARVLLSPIYNEGWHSPAVSISSGAPVTPGPFVVSAAVSLLVLYHCCAHTGPAAWPIANLAINAASTISIEAIKWINVCTSVTSHTLNKHSHVATEIAVKRMGSQRDLLRRFFAKRDDENKRFPSLMREYVVQEQQEEGAFYNPQKIYPKAADATALMQDPMHSPFDNSSQDMVLAHDSPVVANPGKSIVRESISDAPDIISISGGTETASEAFQVIATTTESAPDFKHMNRATLNPKKPAADERRWKEMDFDAACDKLKPLTENFVKVVTKSPKCAVNVGAKADGSEKALEEIMKGYQPDVARVSYILVSLKQGESHIVSVAVFPTADMYGYDAYVCHPDFEKGSEWEKFIKSIEREMLMRHSKKCKITPLQIQIPKEKTSEQAELGAHFISLMTGYALGLKYPRTTHAIGDIQNIMTTLLRLPEKRRHVLYRAMIVYGDSIDKLSTYLTLFERQELKADLIDTLKEDATRFGKLVHAQ